MKGLASGMDLDNAIISFKKLGIEGKDLVKVLENCGFNTGELSEKLTAIESDGAKGAGKLSTAFSGLAAEIGISKAALGAFLGVAAGIAVVTTAVQMYNQYIQKCVDNAREAGSAWSGTNDSIDAYVEKVKELKTALDSGTLTEEAAYNAKSELYSIQQQLIEGYGRQASGIDLVNGKLSEQLWIIQQLSKAEANEFLNENYTGIAKAITEMTKRRTYRLGEIVSTDPYTKSTDERVLDSILDKYSDVIDVIQDTTSPTKTIYFTGNVEEADEVLNEFMSDVREKSAELGGSSLLDGILRTTSGELTDVNSVLENYQSVYKQAQKAQLIADTSLYTHGDTAKTAASWLNDYSTAVQNYNDALASGDASAISAAANEFTRVDSAISALTDGSMSKYADQAADISDQLNRIAIARNNFSKALDGDTSILGKDIKHYAEEIKALGLDDVDLLSMLGSDGYQAGEAQFRSLMMAAKEVGLVSGSSAEDVQRLVNVLVQAGFVSGTTADSFNDVAIDLGSINSKIDSTQSEISSLSNTLSSLRDGSISLEEVIDLIQQFPELAEYVDLTADGFGDLDKGLENLIRHSPDDLIDELQEFKESAELTEWQKEAIDGLCTSLENMSTDAIKDASGEFGVLAEAINGAKRAKTELDKALAEEEYDTGYEGRVQAFEGLQETLNAGELGSKAFAAYKEYFGLMDKNAEQVAAWAKANAKYFTDGTDGVKAFMETVEQMNRSGALSADIASYDSSTGDFRYDINELDAFADALGWTEEMLQDFIYKYRMYCEEWTSRTTELTRQEFFDQGLIMKLDNGQSLASLEQLMEYTRMSEEEVMALVSEINQLNVQDAVSQLEELSKGGNVDLTIRPTVDTSVLADAGWDVVAGESATVFTSTFSNEAGTIAVNFTPIIVDENGNHIGTLSESELTTYAEGVIAGTQDDYLNLQIGAVFEGEDAIAQAEAAATRIHDLHAMVLEGGGLQIIGVDQVIVTQQVIDNLAATKQSAEEVKAALVELSKTEGVTFEAGIEYNGQTVEEILAEATGDGSEVVSVNIKMNVNDEEVLTTITTTANQIETILGKDWKAVITGNTEDAQEQINTVEELLESLPTDTPVTVDGYTSEAQDGLKSVYDLLCDVRQNNYQLVTVEYKTIGDPPQDTTGSKHTGGSTATGGSTTSGNKYYVHATGTKHASRGPALLGDEYSPTGSPKPELVVSEDSAYVAGLNGPEIGYLNDGDIVYTADQTKRILHGSRKNKVPKMPAYKHGVGPNVAYYSDGGGKSRDIVEESAMLAARDSADDQYLISISKLSTSGNAGGSSSLKQTGGSGGGRGGGGSSSNSGSNSDSNSSDDSKSNEKSEFEKLYDQHQHMLAMEQEDLEEYLDWLEKAYVEAYNQGQIELEDFWKYEEEVFEKRKELFQDGLNDIEHKISILEREPGNEDRIVNLYQQMISDIDNEIAAARARGLDDNDDYIQELLDQKYEYVDEIAEIEEEAAENAKNAVDDLVEYRIEMLKQDLENEKDALEDKRDALRDFYDEQKEMLQDAYDEEKYLEEQSEKRRAKSDIEAELAQLEFDDSAWAQKRKLELQEELAKADKDLSDFERDHALEDAQSTLDDMYEKQEAQIQAEIDAIDAKLNDPNALYNQALKDIQNNTEQLYYEMVEYNNKYGDGNPETVKEMWDSAKESLDEFLRTFERAYKDIVLVSSPENADAGGYATGTFNATPGVHKMYEEGEEYTFESSDGNRYRVFSGGEKVLNAEATKFLYNFAMDKGEALSNMFANLLNAISFGNISKPSMPIQLSTGDIIIQGNASERTVSEIRRAQRDNIDHILKEFARLKK